MDVFYLNVLLFIPACASAYAQGHSKFLECHTEEDIDNSLVKLWVSRTQSDQETLINCIETAWAYQSSAPVKSAGFRWHASSLMTSALQFDPDNFFHIMNTNMAFLNEWLFGVSWQAFRWFGDPPCPLDAQLVQIRRLLDNVNSDTRTLRSYQLVYEKFKEIQCSVVN